MRLTKPLVIAAALLLLGAGCGEKSTPVAKRPPATRAEDAIYVVDGTPFELGVRYDVTGEGDDSASATVTKLFGEPIAADLDGDGDLDAAVFLSRETGGTGSFFFVAAAINEKGIYRGTEAYPLGDRIAPQTLEVHDGLIVANFAERKPDEPMTAQPSVGVSKRYRIVDGQLQEAAEAETNP